MLYSTNTTARYSGQLSGQTSQLAPAHQSQATPIEHRPMEYVQQMLDRIPELNMHLEAIVQITQELMTQREQLLRRLPELNMTFAEIAARSVAEDAINVSSRPVLGKRTRSLDSGEACCKEDVAALKRFKF